MQNAVIITAAGSSNRFNEGSSVREKKEFRKMDGHTVLYRSVKPFTAIDGIVLFVVTYSEGLLERTVESLEDLPQGRNFLFVPGGNTRQESVFRALLEINEKYPKINYVAIHDGARPFVTQNLISKTFDKAFLTGAAAPAVELRDTIVIPDENGAIRSRVDRRLIKAVQTPQIFKFSEIFRAHKEAAADKMQYTDDTQIMTDYGADVYLVAGDIDNMKITFAKDLK